ncbi:MAG: polysaccharide biosynthesis tyrosine autokinase [Candidatus Omnitrophica bacterium]|nr:polysaccharide biosynthesis tyrosine autokinase [Candidatus Omnitrophota bacterium]
MNIGDINSTIHIRDYLNVLRNRKWIIISFFVITVTVTTVATLKQENIYKAEATVIVDTRSPDVFSGRQVADVVELGESNYWGYKDYIETQKEIIRSRRLAYSVLKSLNLDKKEEFKKVEDPIARLLRKVQVKTRVSTRMLQIEALDKDPKQAADIANEFAKAYVDSNISLKIKTSNQAQEWLRKEVENQKQKVTESELNLQNYKEENNIVSVRNQENMINNSFDNLNSGYINAQKKRVRAETTYKSLIDEEGNTILDNLPALLTDNVTLQQLKNDYLKQETLLSEYKKVYKYKHPKMIRLLESINYLDSRIKSEVQSEYNSALEEENEMKKALDKEKKSAIELDRKRINYNALKRELETNERILDIVLNRLKETSIASQVQANNVRLQDFAEIPNKPVRPKRRLNIALSIIFGLVGGMTIAFFKEYMDVTIKNPMEIAALLNVPVLGSVPRVKPDGKKIRRKTDIDRIVEKDAYSFAAEAYRSIRTNLLFSINQSGSAKSIVITSSVPREGKTLTAVNLATMIANGGERVLLVDADMRKPRVHAVFNDKNETGLSDFLLNKKDFNSIVKSTGIDNLYLVTAGKNTHKPAELLYSQNMKVFLDNASSQFSKIIFDTPPIAIITDAQILSNMCTGTVIVVEGSKATKTLLSRSKDLLEKAGANVLGVIVNNTSLTNDPYSYSQYSYGKYYSSV